MSPASAADLLSDHHEVARRLRWLERVGLGYLSIGQSLDTLSGGERQRLLLADRLADASAEDVLRIVLDEPTAGLHGTDIDRFLTLCDELVDDGATLVLVEHDQRVIVRADHVIDLGPGAGHRGGTIVYQGPPSGLLETQGSITGHHLRVGRESCRWVSVG